jgi:hypothetical protein
VRFIEQRWIVFKCNAAVSKGSWLPALAASGELAWPLRSPFCLLPGMHSCLQIRELVEAIISPWLLDDYRTLTALAVTCQMFHGPASDVIWADLPSLAPLIKCLPAHLWEERGNDDDSQDGGESSNNWLGQERSAKLVSPQCQLLVGVDVTYCPVPQTSPTHC